MSGLPPRPAITLLLVLAIFGAGFGCAWCWQTNRYAAVMADRELSYQADIGLINSVAAAQTRNALAKQQQSEQARDRIDQQATSEKDQLYADNQALRLAVTDGSRRLRIAGSCRSGGGDVPNSASATGVDNAGAVELDSTAGQRVLDLRAAIIADQSALSALQRYVREVCFK